MSCRGTILRRRSSDVTPHSALTHCFVGDGWAERVADTEDRRKAALVMADEGIRALQEMESRIEDVIAEALAKVDRSELGSLTARQIPSP